MTPTTPYGAWTSPISPSMLAGGSISFWSMTSDGDDVYWGEFRPAEAGRIAVMRWRDGGIEEIAAPFSARTLAHEYGGASVAASRGRLVGSSVADQRVYRLDEETPRPITPEPPVARGWRYADTVFSGDQLLAVREDHTGDGEAITTIVRFDAEGSTEPVVIVEGHDFYASPRPSPDGGQLAWLAWNHPNMPWNHTELWVGDLTDEGVANARKIPTLGESFFQPEWSPNGELHVVSDRSGWWNLYRLEGDTLVNLYPANHEFGVPAWLFGYKTYAFLDADRIAVTFADRGMWSLGVLEAGALHPLDLGGRRAGSPWMTTAGGKIWTVFGGPAEPSSVLAVDPSSGFEVVKESTSLAVDREYISSPEAIEFPTSKDETAHAFLYRPANPDHVAAEAELPPLIVFSHGGPTSQTLPSFNLGIQFWTTRGFAVADVNYRGSTGYGTPYRDALMGNWGDVDVVDCVRVAEYLADEGVVDGERLAIRGGSAGGYVTLCALTFHDTFKAGTSYCGVADITALMETTHKFEARYDETLIGPMPESRELADSRSPINYADRVSCPILVIQGAEDPIVTPDQAEVFVDAMASNGLPHAFMLIEGEDHFLAKSDTVIATREAELSFYGQLFGFEPAGEITPIKIQNL